MGVLKLRALRRAVRSRLPHHLLMRAYLGAFVKGRKLPPGMIEGLDDLQRADRKAMLTQAKELGPIFKAVAHDRLLVYVVGLALGRRLLKDHAEELEGMSIQLEPMVPNGFMRAMHGEVHRRYRRNLMRAVVAEDVAAQLGVLETFAADRLSHYATSGESNGWAAASYLASLSDIATGMLIGVVFGARPGTTAFEQLVGGFRALGPNGFEWVIGEPQRRAFEVLKTSLRSLCRDEPGTSSILHRLDGAGLLDETMLGNLIYMVEMGRYDTRGLFRWLSKYAAEYPDLIGRIAGEGESSGEGTSLADRFVLETLRSDQSEALIRRARRDFSFEGFLIPANTVVRICMWESHHLEEVFPEPFRFRPERFRQPMGADQFSPFGLDQHQCPFGTIAMTIGTLFLRTLARRFEVAAVEDGPPVRGRDLWEPAKEFSVRLQARSAR